MTAMTTALGPVEIQSDSYTVAYDPALQTVTFIGALRLAGMEEYAPISQLLSDVLEQQCEKVTLDLRQLEFLNSSGINMLSKFVIKVRQQNKSNLTVIGAQMTPWQGKSLKNLQRLLPTLVLELV
jgi:hypothetical protein